jgi:hypothetical protein
LTASVDPARGVTTIRTHAAPRRALLPPPADGPDTPRRETRADTATHQRPETRGGAFVWWENTYKALAGGYRVHGDLRSLSSPRPQRLADKTGGDGEVAAMIARRLSLQKERTPSALSSSGNASHQPAHVQIAVPPGAGAAEKDS